MAGEIVVKKDCSVLKIVQTLKGTQSFPQIGAKYHALGGQLGVSLAECHLEQYWELLRRNLIGLEYAMDVLIREWVEKKGDAARLDDLLGALDSLGLKDGVEALRKEFGYEDAKAEPSTSASEGEGGARKRKRAWYSCPEVSQSFAAPFSISNGSDSNSSDTDDTVEKKPLLGIKLEVPEGEAGESGSDSTTTSSQNQVNERGPLGNTPLHQAAEALDEDSIRKLVVERKADLNAKNDKGLTPLHNAAIYARKNSDISARFTSWLQTINFLIEHGADALAKDNQDRNFLHRLFSAKTTITPWQLEELVKFLISKGMVGLFTSPNKKWLVTPLHLAVQFVEVQESTLALLREAIDDLNFNLPDHSGCSVLSYAVRGDRSVALLRGLIDFGADPEVVGTAMLHDPLQIVAMRGNPDAVAFFIQLGLDINAKDKLGMTPLHLAVCGRMKRQIYEVVSTLLENGANKRIKDERGKTPHNKAMGLSDYARKEDVLYLLR